MITVPTTLVLGAGASKPYGFPSGYELRQLLCNPNSLQGLTQCGFAERDIATFSETFLKSGMQSIDAFLARRGTHKVGTYENITFADIGKAAIAYCLIQCEKPELLHSVKNDHWYEYLWSFLSDSLDSFGENKLRIITFNYDRSLEYYLLTALQHSFGITQQEAGQYLKKLPILHVYGQLAELPELSGCGVQTRSYSPDISNHPSFVVSAAAQGIRVIDESRDDDEVFERAFSYLANSERICFLGFGFDLTNLRRLRITTLVENIRNMATESPRIFATTLGLADAERGQVINKLNTAKSPAYSNVTKSNIERCDYCESELYLRAAGVLIQ